MAHGRNSLKKAAAFYRDILGLDLVMDHGWFQTYGSDAKMTFQVSFGTEGGSGTPVPDLSIEVDHLEVALARFKKANVPIEYGPVSARPGAYEGSLYAIHSESLLTFCNTK